MKWQDVKKLHLEISALCNAVCPQCARYPTSSYYEHPSIKNTDVWTIDQVQQRLPASDLKNIEHVLINGTMGDFITNKHALSIVQHIHDASPTCKILINTNGSARTSRWWEELAYIPNLTVNFALDGLEDTHSLYRRNTNWQTIIDNARAFIKQGGCADWTMTIFEHNQHQVEDCQRLARELGFKNFWARHTDRTSVPARDRQGQTTHWIRPATNSPMSIGEITEAEMQAKEHRLIERPDLFRSKKQVHNNIPLPSLDACDSLRERSIYVGANWTVTPCCFLGILSFTKESDHRYDNFVQAAQESNIDLNSLTATNTQTVKSIVDSGFDWIYDRITTDKALTGCYFHCHPKDANYRVSQATIQRS